MSEEPRTFCPTCRKFLSSEEVYWSCWRLLPDDLPVAGPDVHSAARESFDDDDGVFQKESAGCYTLNERGKNTCSNPVCGLPRVAEESRDACRYCKSELPNFLQGLEPKTLTVTGPSGAGKSHYIIALHEWWTYFLGDLGLGHFSAMGRNNEIIFDKMRHAVVDLKQPLPQTRKGDKISFSWQIMPPASYNQSGLLITLPDVSGERLYDARALNENRHYWYAGGIIFLMDADRLGGAAYTHGSKVRPAADHMRVANAMIQDFRSRMPGGEWTEIPIAVCVNKVDTLLTRDPEWDQIINRIIPEHVGGFDLASCDARSSRIRSLLWQAPASKPVVNLIDNNFVQVRYFGIATLGGSAEPGGTQPLDLNPISVEDPFLWLLYARGYINNA